ncbi:MAG: hypothetical protein HC927_09655 [Deltaproteobacteria bacterium]|nr:hypothetical protein [Deltaproteobacteria bacterium]
MGGAESAERRRLTDAGYEFADQQEAMFGRLLRRRFLWFAWFVLVLALLTMSGNIVALFSGESERWTATGPRISWVLYLLTAAAGAGVLIWSIARVHNSRGEYRLVLATLDRVMVWLGGLELLGMVLFIESAERVLSNEAAAEEIRLLQQSESFAGFGGAFLIACLFLPWRFEDSARTLIKVLVWFIGFSVLYNWGEWGRMVMYPVLLLMLATPGLMIANWRYGKYQGRFDFELVSSGYRRMQQELVDARRLHDMLFPAAIEDGVASVVYRYEPMQQIGGDFVFVHRERRDDGGGAIVAVIIDVTGHGITAALAVNRLHGELEREIGMDPGLRPRR